MSLKKLCLVLLTVLTVRCGNVESKDSEDLTCIETNQDMKEYFRGTELKKIQWFHITNKDELEAALIQDAMLVIDVKLENDKIMISDDYALNDFLAQITSSDKRKGLKYNIKDEKTFEALFYKRPSRDRATDLSPFPQWFHINVFKTGEDPLFNDVLKIFEERKNSSNCYTFSFGWDDDKCSTLIDTEVDEMIANAKKFDVDRKNLVIDLANLPSEDKVADLTEVFQTITFMVNEKNARCAKPKTLDEDLSKIDIFGEKLMKDGEVPKFLYTHEKLCKSNKLFVDTFNEPNKHSDMAEVTWKSVTKFEDLGTKVKEDVVKVDIDDPVLEKMFLGKNFETFIDEFATKQGGKGLQLNFKTQDSFDSYWNIEHSKLEDIKEIPFSVKFVPALDVKGIEFAYEEYGWLDCYTIFFSAEEGSGAYEKTKIEKVIAMAKITEAKEKIISLNLERAIESKSSEAIKAIDDESTLGLSVIDESTKDLKKVRNFLRERSGGIFFDLNDVEAREKVFRGVLITDLVPEVGDDLTLLEFHKPIVDNPAHMEEALKGKNTMIQADVSLKKDSDDIIVGTGYDLKTCLDDLEKESKNGIKLHFSSNAVFEKTLAKGYLKYLNSPVWLELDVIGTNQVKLELHTSNLEKLGHKLVLSFGKSKMEAEPMKTERQKIEKSTVITFLIKATDIADEDKSKELTKLFGNSTDTMLLMLTSEETVVSKNIRKNLPENVKYYANIPHKWILEECPKNQDVFDYFPIAKNDLSKLMLSDFIKSKDDIAKAIKDEIHMLNVAVGENKNVAIINEKITLLELLETVEKQKDKVGIKLAFNSTEAFNAATSDINIVKKMRGLNRPVWISANVISENGTIVIKLDYNSNNDLLDCRNLCLGWEGSSEKKYVEDNLKEMNKLLLGENEKMYVVDMIHIMKHFDEINDHLLMGIKNVPNGNKIMLAFKEDEVDTLDVTGLEDFLNKHLDLFFYDMTYTIKTALFGGSATTLSSSLVLALVLALILMILQ